MSSDDYAMGVTGFVAGMIVMCFIGIGVDGCQENRSRQDAVKHGAAKFIATDAGEVEFKWNDELKDKEQ